MRPINHFHGDLTWRQNPQPTVRDLEEVSFSEIARFHNKELFAKRKYLTTSLITCEEERKRERFNLKKISAMKVSVVVAVVLLFTVLELGFCREFGIVTMKRMGDMRNCKGSQNSAEIESLARFAVQEHNRLENGLLEFARVVKVQEQVVAGKLYHLTLEAIDAGKKKIYKAKIWVKPWMNFKQLQEFKHASNVSPLSVSDFSIIHGSQDMPIYDPEVRSAANHAVKGIQKRSNSLLPYELLEVLHAKAEIIENFVKYDLLLKLKRGVQEEMFKVNVHKTYAGNYLLTLMEPLGV